MKPKDELIELTCAQCGNKFKKKKSIYEYFRALGRQKFYCKRSCFAVVRKAIFV